MSQPRIGIIISTTREKRFGARVADWIYRLGSQRSDLAFEIVDLRDYPLPFFEGDSPAYVPVTHEVAQRWARKMAELDGYLFVTAEYNRSIPGALKNALDWAYNEYHRKPAAYVGYGGVGAARAIEQLRLINVELQMAPTRSGVHIGGSDFIDVKRQGRPLEELPHLAQAASVLFDELAWWAKVLKAGRIQSL